jgi:hypothetical protein
MKNATYPKFELAVGKDPIRPNMHNIYIDGEAGHIVATNGHLLVAMPIYQMPYSIPMECYNKGITPDGWKAIWHKTTISVEFDANLFTVIDNKGNTRLFPLVQVDKFPDWLKLFGNVGSVDNVERSAMSFNGEYMAVLQQAFASWAITLIPSQKGDNTAYYAIPNILECRGTFGLIMPVFIDKHDMRRKLVDKVRLLEKCEVTFKQNEV